MIRIYNTSVKDINHELMRSNNVYGVYKIDSIKKQYKSVFTKFNKHINNIGIFSLPIQKYENSQKIISDLITQKKDVNKWKKVFQKLVFEKSKYVLLRGSYYYNWLPTYIFNNNRTIFIKWKNLFNTSCEGLDLIYRYHLLSSWSQFNNEEQLLILCIVDHYKNSIFQVLNNIYYTSLNCPIHLSNRDFTNLNIIAQECTDLYYGLLFNKVKNKNLERLIKYCKKTEITKIIKRNQQKQQGMRELDDPQIIVLSILSLLRQIEAKKKKYDMVINFPCGGTELGFAFISVFKLLNKIPPGIINCLYSSKRIMRDPTIASKKESIHWLFNFIPEYYHQALKKQINKKGKILLYDNNVTTFSTLADVKSFFKSVYNMSVDGAVVAIYYSNISKCLLGKKSESLVSDWQKVLDYKPVTDYITAFNTWGTSKKGKIIENIYHSFKKP